MGDKSAIEWTDSTWTPIRGVGPDRWVCQKVSPGCDHCYASRCNQSAILNPARGDAYPEAGPLTIFAVQPGKPYGVPSGRSPRFVRLDESMLTQPLRWAKPRKVFVCSMTDLFGEWVPDEWIDRVFAVMALAPRHTFQVLTKRAKRMRGYFAGADLYDRWLRAADELRAARPEVLRIGVSDWQIRPLPNVWLGVSVENQAFVHRLNYLSETPAAVRFVSAEPLLGPIDFGPRLQSIDWLITGGESGGPASRQLVQRCGWCGGGAPVAECMHCYGQPWQPKPDALEWVRLIRDQCDQAEVFYLHKQWGGPKPKSGGRLLDGRTWDEYPRVAA